MSEPAGIDPDDLATASELARELGVWATAIHNCRARHADFPAPVIDRPRVTMWSRAAVLEWWEARGAARNL